MDHPTIPASSTDLAVLIVAGIHATYDMNALRHDELVGDDGVTFGFNMYRNVWYRVEQDLRESSEWKTARPDGSLVITGEGCRIHIYRFGQNELVDLNQFRLNEAKSYTKKSIAQNNGQLSFDLETSESSDSSPKGVLELVIVHAGNPEDGCCGIWLGAPVCAEEANASPWAAIRPLWLIDRGSSDSGQSTVDHVPIKHSDLPEPIVMVEEVLGEETATGQK